MESFPCFHVLWWSWPALLSLSLTWELGLACVMNWSSWKGSLSVGLLFGWVSPLAGSLQCYKECWWCQGTKQKHPTQLLVGLFLISVESYTPSWDTFPVFSERLRLIHRVIWKPKLTLDKWCGRNQDCCLSTWGACLAALFYLTKVHT